MTSGDARRGDSGPGTARLALVAGVTAALALVGVLAASVLIPVRPHRPNHAAAVGSLRALHAAQGIRVVKDREAGGPGRVAGRLVELAEAGLIDEVLGSGTRQGYLFQLAAAPDGSSWMATASPRIPGTTGDEWYAITADGQVFRSAAPIPLAPGAPLPPGAEPLGRPRGAPAPVVSGS